MESVLYKLTLSEAAALISLNKFEMQGVKTFQKLDTILNKLDAHFGKVADNGAISLHQAATKMRGSMGGLTSWMWGTGITAGAGLAAGIAYAGKEAAILGANMEQTRGSFETMMGGNKQAANEFISELQKFADITPYDTTEVIGVGRAFLGVKIPVSEMTDLMRDAGDVAAGAQTDFGDLSKQMAKWKSSEIIQTEDINQMTDRGIPIMDYLMKVTGARSSLEVRKFAENNKISFDDVRAAMKLMTSEGGIFFGMMDKQSKTVAGRWSTFTSTIANIGTMMGEAMLPMAGTVVDGLQSVVAFVNSNKDAIAGMFHPVVELFKPIREGFASLLKNMGITGDMTTDLHAGFNAFGNGLARVVEFLKPVGKLIGETIGYAGQLYAAFKKFEDNTGFFSGAYNSLKSMISFVAGTASKVIGGFADMLDGIFSFDGSNWKESIDKIKAGFGKLNSGNNGVLDFAMQSVLPSSFVDKHLKGGEAYKSQDFFSQNSPTRALVAQMNPLLRLAAQVKQDDNPFKTPAVTGEKKPSKTDILSENTTKGGDSGAGSGRNGGGNGGNKHVTIRIDTGIKEIHIHTTNMNQGVADAKRQFQEFLMDIETDVSIMANLQ